MMTANDLRVEISSQIAYLRLCASIMKNIPGQKFIAQVKQTTLLTDELLRNSDNEEVIAKAQKIIKLLTPIITTAKKIYPPKKSIIEIAASFQDYCTKNPSAFSEFGYYYGWLQQQVDCRSLYSQPVPAHARVGTFFNAGKFIIEEGIILRDAFYFLVLAEKELRELEMYANKLQESRVEPTKEELNRAGVYNANVGTFCRAGLLNFYSFIEAYLNGIGLNHLFLYEASLNEREKEILNGKEGKHCLPLEKKLEKFQRIIRSDKKTVFVTTSKEQLKEPFITFLSECKNIRNATVHFAATKDPIVRKPHDWMERLVSYGKNTMEVAQKFWEACYETKSYPDYLDLLSFDILKELAVKRYQGIAH